MTTIPILITLDCRYLSFFDYAAIAALKTLRNHYQRACRQLRVLKLSPRCKQLFKRSRNGPNA